jgi:DNA repair exonuclease SbcCD ATPase subunit
VVDDEADKKAALVADEIRSVESQISLGCQDIEQTKGDAAHLSAELSALDAARLELMQAEEEKGQLSRDTSEWIYLRDACGKAGLQAMEIDGAAPRITYQANQLLHRGFGPGFSVRIDTQDEEGNEIFDIKVLSEEGVESYKLKSGGEKIWLLHAVRLAMTLLNKEKSGRAFDAAFLDELDGPLDVTAATKFMEMCRPFVELGNFKQLFYISHKDESLAYADHVLRFTGKGVEVE